MTDAQMTPAILVTKEDEEAPERANKLADEESLLVVSAYYDQDAYIFHVSEVQAGIVISHAPKDTIHTDEYFEKADYDEVNAIEAAMDDVELADECVSDIELEEVAEVDTKILQQGVEALGEFYNDEDIMDALLEATLHPDEPDPSTLAELGEIETELRRGRAESTASLSTGGGRRARAESVADGVCSPSGRRTRASSTADGAVEPSEAPVESSSSKKDPVVYAAPPSAVLEVYSKYGCRAVGAGGPVAMKELAAAYVLDTELDDSFYIMDLANVQRLYEAWHSAMPRVRPFYAVKCSPMPAVIELLAANGCGFDCASAAEIQLVMDAGIAPDRIIFAHPAKRPSDIRFAAKHDVGLTTFDSVVELEKISKWHPKAECVLRIRADDPNAGISFGIKYGAEFCEYDMLFAKAKALDLRVVGVSFHVGSLARSGSAFYEAIKLARVAFDAAIALGYDMRLLDLGGGFTGRFNSWGIVQSMVGDIPANINEALREFFEDATFPHLEVIAEPGRFFAEASMHLACHVHSVRNRKDTCDYLISDGLYGSFNCVVYDGAKPRAWLLPGPTLPPMESTELQRSTVFGPTCDSMDCVFKDVMLPQLRVGDWLLFPNFGAYTLAGATNFNGIQAALPPIMYIESRTPVDDDDEVVMWACESTTPPSAIVAPA